MVQTIDVFPHLARDAVANGPRIFPRLSDALHDGVGIVRTKRQELIHRLRIRLLVELGEALLLARPLFNACFPTHDNSPATRPIPRLFPARIWCIFLRTWLLQTLLFGPSITLGGDSGHGAAAQSGLKSSVRQVTG